MASQNFRRARIWSRASTPTSSPAAQCLRSACRGHFLWLTLTRGSQATDARSAPCPGSKVMSTPPCPVQFLFSSLRRASLWFLTLLSPELSVCMGVAREGKWSVEISIAQRASGRLLHGRAGFDASLEQVLMLLGFCSCVLQKMCWRAWTLEMGQT